MILLQFLAFHGESDWKMTYGKEIKAHFSSGMKFFNSTTLSRLLVSLICLVTPLSGYESLNSTLLDLRVSAIMHRSNYI